MALKFLNDGYFAGKVGIGTESPNAKLEVNSTITFSTIDTFGQLVVKAASGSTGDMLNIGVDTANSVAFIQANDRGVGTIPLSLQRYGGNVGIGNTNPQYPLHFGDISGYYISIGSGNSTSGGNTPWLGVFNNNSIASATYGWGIYDSSADGSFQIWNRAGNTTGYNTFTIKRGGNVGIGTTSPVHKLQVNDGNVAITGGTTSTLFMNITTNQLYGDVNGVVILKANDNLRLNTNGAERMRIDSTGNVGIGVTNPLDKLHVDGRVRTSSSGVAIGDTNAVIYRNSNDLELITYGGYDINLMPSGNVGIGTITPSQKLHVAGNLRVTGAYYDSNNSPGTANQVLISTVSGTDWVDGSAIPGVPAGSGAAGQVTVWSGTDVITGYTRFQVYDAGGQIQITDGTRDIRINSGYAGSTAMIGTSSSHDLGFMTGNSQRVTIDTSGNVGIGETSPSSKLVVAENINPAITILDTTTIPAGTQNAGNNITFGTLQFQWGAESYSYMPSIEARFNETDASFGRKAGLDFKVGNVASVTAMSILSSGEVGVGTTSPGTINSVAFSGVGLHVKSGTLGRTITEGSSEASYLLNNSGASANQRIKYIQSTAGNLAIGSFDDNGLARPQITVLNSGDVGIGTTSPGADLHVNSVNTAGTVIVGRTGANINASTSIGTITFPADYNASAANYAQVRAYSNALSSLRGSLDFNVKSTSGNLLTGLTIYGTNSGVNVGIGITGPTSLLHLSKAGGVIIKLGTSQNTSEIEAREVGGGNNLVFSTNNSADNLTIDGTGSIQFNNYNLSNNTGTPTYLLGTDGSGNVVKTTTIPGSAAGPYLPLAGGNMTGTGSIDMPDNFSLLLGGILKIFNDGSNSIIRSQGDPLFIDSNGITFRGYSPYDTLATITSSGISIKAALLSNQENTDVDTGTETVASVAVATYTAAFFDFVIKKTTNVRSGTVYACHDGTNVEFTETSTQDLGDTSDVTLSVDISGGNMRLLATVTSDDWSVKSLIRAI